VDSPLKRKIVDPRRLSEVLAAARRAGRRIVQCHGCFDIVHPGHIRYLQSARQLGDVLVVSLTGDQSVEKGPDRPYIPQELRAENLAALEFVDWVVIDPHPTACELLEVLRPDVYVKGREYATANDPRFLRERAIVEGYGGRVVFHSGDVVFSSTRLIESLGRDNHLEEWRLRSLCERNRIDSARVMGTLEAFVGLPALVVGDVVRERYVFCDPDGTAEDAPALSLQRLGASDYWGGAAAVALQLQALGARPVLIAAAGTDQASDELAGLCAQRGIDGYLPGLRRELVRRTMLIADDAKLMRISEGSAVPLDSAAEKLIFDRVCEHLPSVRVLLWADHGYGMITPGLVWAVTQAARRAEVLVTGYAPGPRGEIGKLRGTDVLVLTERQLREAVHDMSSGLSSVAWNLLYSTAGRSAVVSLHRRGLICFDGRGQNEQPCAPADGSESATPQPYSLERLRSEFIPALAVHHVDRLGADEAVLSSAGLALAVGASLPLATYLAAAAEALAVARPGRTLVSLGELQTWLGQRPELGGESRFLPEQSPAARAEEDPSGQQASRQLSGVTR